MDLRYWHVLSHFNFITWFRTRPQLSSETTIPFGRRRCVWNLSKLWHVSTKRIFEGIFDISSDLKGQFIICKIDVAIYWTLANQNLSLNYKHFTICCSFEVLSVSQDHTVHLVSWLQIISCFDRRKKIILRFWKIYNVWKLFVAFIFRSKWDC